MKFLLILIKDYTRAYCIVIKQYPALLRHFFIATLFMLAIAALNAAVPYLLRETINTLSLPGQNNYRRYALLFAAAYGLCWTSAQVFQWLKTILSSSMLARCDAAFQRCYFAHLVRVEYKELIKIDPGDIVSKITRSRTAFSAITYTLFWIITPTLLQLILSAIVIWKFIGVGFLFTFLVSIMALFAATCWLSGKTKNAHSAIFAADNRLSSHMVEKLNFTLDIKINDAYEKEGQLLDIILGNTVKMISSGNRRLAILLAIQALLTGVLLASFTLVSVNEVMQDRMQIGDFIMVTGYILALTAPFTSLAGSLSELRRNHLAMREGFNILEMNIETGLSTASFVNKSSNAYALEDVGLTINGKVVFKNINFMAKKGEVTVICGPSGNGKSSLLNLLLGLLRPDNGLIALNNINLGLLATKAITAEVAVAPQNPLILNGSLRDNLSFGCKQTPSEALLKELVNNLELQSLDKKNPHAILDYKLGNQNNSVSGGEKQRIALGRALARKTSIIILDEPTSSLDSAREARIFEYIRKRVETIIIVTHRQAIIDKADRVYEVSHGGIGLIK